MTVFVYLAIINIYKGADTVVSDIDGLRYTTLLYGTGPGHAEPRALPLNASSPAAANADAVHASAVPRQWATHGGEDVPIWALGKSLDFYYLTMIIIIILNIKILRADRICFKFWHKDCLLRSNMLQIRENYRTFYNKGQLNDCKVINSVILRVIGIEFNTNSRTYLPSQSRCFVHSYTRASLCYSFLTL